MEETSEDNDLINKSANDAETDNQKHKVVTWLVTHMIQWKQDLTVASDDDER